MQISVVDLTRGHVERDVLKRYLRAVNRQLAHDVAPHWDTLGVLELVDGRSLRRDTRRLDRLPGDAVIFVEAKARPGDYDGFHAVNAWGIPFGVVSLSIANALGEDLSVTLSHEAIELVVDPQSNLFAAGPHPNPRARGTVLFWYEACDAVQDERYTVDGVKVSNFVLPLYYTLGEQRAGRNDFLGKREGRDLPSFGVNPGGYVGYTSPNTWRGYVYEPDARSKERAGIKQRAKLTRRSTRYKAVNQRVLESAPLRTTR